MISSRGLQDIAHVRHGFFTREGGRSEGIYAALNCGFGSNDDPERVAANRDIVVITDGEPTAHFEGGQVEFSYPPTRRTISETLREVQRCTKDGITINTFMLERSRALAEFVAHMTKLNRGRAFYATPERLGEYVLVDFVGRRSKRVS